MYQPFSDVITLSGDTLAERYERTMLRLEQITRAGYLVKVQWECEFDDAERPEMFAHPIVEQSPLRTRDALYGGRTEAMHLHYKSRENETIQYVDIMSLYHYICMYFKFSVGHPIIHVRDACKDIEPCLCMEGLIKYLIVPPERLYHPALPFRCIKNLMSCLCRTCVVTSSSEECVHILDEDQDLTGTWVMDEVRFAVEKGTGYSKYMRCTSIKSPNTTPKQARADFRGLYKYIFKTESGDQGLSRLGQQS